MQMKNLTLLCCTFTLNSRVPLAIDKYDLYLSISMVLLIQCRICYWNSKDFNCQNKMLETQVTSTSINKVVSIPFPLDILSLED